MSSEHFLSRWSRRKQEVRENGQRDQNDVPPHAEAPALETLSDPCPPEAGKPIEPADAEISAEEIAALPSLEELTADTDITAFLRKGVPERLRNAALRRMWSLDPKIRDFVCEAREYAYDWNTPGGVPGFGGPLPPAEEIRKLAEQIVGAVRPSTDVGGETTAGGPSSRSHIRERSRSDSNPLEDMASGRSPAGAEPRVIREQPCPQESLAAEPVRDVTESREPGFSVRVTPSDAGRDTEQVRQRRHGGAKPL